MRVILSFLLCLILYAPVFGAVAYDTSNTASSTGATSLTISAYAVTGSNTLMLCSAALLATDTDVTSVVFDGSQPLALVSDASGLNESLTLWYRVGVSGTGDVVFSFADAGPGKTVVGCSTFTGVDPGTPLGSPVTGTDYVSAPVNITVPADGLGYDVAADYNQTPDPIVAQTAGGSQTKRLEDSITGGTGDNVAHFSSTRAASGTFTWTAPGGQDSKQIGVPINPVAASAPRRTIIIE